MATPVPCCTMQPHQKNLFCPPIVMRCSSVCGFLLTSSSLKDQKVTGLGFFLIAEYSARNIALDKKIRRKDVQQGLEKHLS